MPQNTSTLGFLLLGPLQKNSTITKEFLQKHNVTYLGECSDVRDFIARSFCVVLPSYYKEGVPRVLLEAMSMEKPIITTNVSGCRECLKPPFLPKKDFTLAQNGILIPPQDASALESAMRYLLALPLTSYQKMAKQSRVYAIQRFEISFIKQAYKDAIRHFLAPPPRGQKSTLAFVCNSAFGMYNFRLAILQELQSMGYKILIIAPKDEYTHKFYALGFESVHLPISSHSLNPLKDLKTYFCLRKIFQKHHPDFIFHYTIKPIIYGSLAAKDIPNIAITTGLGHAFLANNPLRKALKLLVCWLYRISLRHAREAWFLNQDDRDEFLAQKILCEKKCKILDSEGIDTQYFAPRNDTQALAEKNSNHIEPSYTSSPPEREFLLIARMLKEKGIEEFLHAADNFKK